MSDKSLRISDDLRLPLDAATQTFSILAKRRVGKSYTASKMAEEFVAAGLPFVALDPTGAWWGLRSSADGKKEGLPVFILGGAHGDLPLEPTSGKVIADLVVDHPGFYILDLSSTESNAAQDRFAMDFAERLYRRKERSRFPLHLFVDEADSFAPQRPMPGQQRMLGAFEALVRRGGIRGVGVTLITQRPAVLNKNVFTQTEVLIALQTTAPQDQDAIDDWVKRNGTAENRAELMGSLASLQKGEAWIWSPAWLQIFKRVRINQKWTFDSGKTPEVGEKVLEPKKLAAVDLEKLGKEIQATVERAKENDPGELRKQIAELKRVIGAKSATPAPEKPAEPIHVPVLSKSDLMEFKLVADGIEVVMKNVQTGLENSNRSLKDCLAQFTQKLSRFSAGAPHAAGKVARSPIPRRAPARLPPTVHSRARPTEADAGSNFGLDNTARRALNTIAMLNARGIAVTRESVARWMGIHRGGGRYLKGLAALRAHGLLQDWSLTDAGADGAGPFTTGIDEVAKVLKDGTCRRSWEALLEEHPREFTREELAEKLGIHPGGGRFLKGLAWLRDMGVISGRSPIRIEEGAFA